MNFWFMGQQKGLQVQNPSPPTAPLLRRGARARRAAQQDASGNLGAHLHEALRRPQEVHDLGQLLPSARNVAAKPILAMPFREEQKWA